MTISLIFLGACLVFNGYPICDVIGKLGLSETEDRNTMESIASEEAPKQVDPSQMSSGSAKIRDEKSPIYTLVIMPDQSYEVYIDNKVVSSGNLLADAKMTENRDVTKSESIANDKPTEKMEGEKIEGDPGFSMSSDESCGDVTCIKRIPEMLPQLAVIVIVDSDDTKSDIVVKHSSLVDFCNGQADIFPGVPGTKRSATCLGRQDVSVAQMAGGGTCDGKPCCRVENYYIGSRLDDGFTISSCSDANNNEICRHYGVQKLPFIVVIVADKDFSRLPEQLKKVMNSIIENLTISKMEPVEDNTKSVGTQMACAFVGSLLGGSLVLGSAIIIARAIDFSATGVVPASLAAKAAAAAANGNSVFFQQAVQAMQSIGASGVNIVKLVVCLCGLWLGTFIGAFYGSA